MKALNLRKDNLPTDLAFIKSYFSFMSHTITGQIRRQRFTGFTDIRPSGKHARLKMHALGSIVLLDQKNFVCKKNIGFVFKKNEGFTKLKELVFSFIDNGDAGVISSISRDPFIVTAYTYAPLTFIDLERSFSGYKCVVSDRRHNLTVWKMPRSM